MDRLTTKNYHSFCPFPKYDTYYPLEAKEKLGKLEDLEERIGCSIEVIFRALKDGIYTNSNIFYNGDEVEYFKVRGAKLEGLSVISNDAPYPECDFTCYYKNYKKTWWLKADKSE